MLHATIYFNMGGVNKGLHVFGACVGEGGALCITRNVDTS